MIAIILIVLLLAAQSFLYYYVFKDAGFITDSDEKKYLYAPKANFKTDDTPEKNVLGDYNQYLVVPESTAPPSEGLVTAESLTASLANYQTIAAFDTWKTTRENAVTQQIADGATNVGSGFARNFMSLANGSHDFKHPQRLKHLVNNNATFPAWLKGGILKQVDDGVSGTPSVPISPILPAGRDADIYTDSNGDWVFEHKTIGDNQPVTDGITNTAFGGHDSADNTIKDYGSKSNIVKGGSTLKFKYWLKSTGKVHGTEPGRDYDSVVKNFTFETS